MEDGAWARLELQWADYSSIWVQTGGKSTVDKVPVDMREASALVDGAVGDSNDDDPTRTGASGSRLY